MGQRGRHHNKRQNPRTASTAFRAPPLVMEKKVPVIYGKAIIVMENAKKETFVFAGGKWVAHVKTIAQCREDSQVKELNQKINGMTRYEVCSPLPVAT